MTKTERKEAMSTERLARAYVKARAALKDAEESFDAARDELIEAMDVDERCEVCVGRWTYEILKHEVERIDVDEIDRDTVERVVPGGWKKCLEPKLSVKKLRGLMALNPGLVPVVPVSVGEQLKVTEKP